MDKTPKSLRFVRNGNEGNNSSLPKTNIISTPVKQSKKPRIWDTDICSQESSDIDVAWDWDSPKNIKPKTLHRTKEEFRELPKLPPKKISQVDHIKNFEKLREELQALRNEIARVDDDDCIALSLDEQAFKEESAKDSSDINSFIEEQYFHTEETENLLNMDDNLPKIEYNKSADSLFDASCDEQLLLYTQIIEEKLLQSTIEKVGTSSCEKIQKNNFAKNKQGISATDFSTFNKKEVSDSCNLSTNRVIEQNHMDIKTVKFQKTMTNDVALSANNDFEKSISCKTADDSFDAVLKDFNDEDIESLTQTNNNNVKTLVPRKFQSSSNLNSSFKRTFSDANVQYSPIKVESVKMSKFAFHRTHSFESAATKEDDLPQHIMEEIERKRNEALARLKEKKEKEKRQMKPIDETYSNVSPMKCSPEEIEQKRLQAQAIRQAKQKEIIEKNRLEAIKRLELNRQKRLGSTLKNSQNKVIK